VKMFIRLNYFSCSGYGLTETCATGSASFDVKLDHETIGFPYYQLEVQLESIPEMEYSVHDKFVCL
jgi:long-subunit acyl-CoA synthetase (AMP-forming)